MSVLRSSLLIAVAAPALLNGFAADASDVPPSSYPDEDPGYYVSNDDYSVDYDDTTSSSDDYSVSYDDDEMCEYYDEELGEVVNTCDDTASDDAAQDQIDPSLGYAHSGSYEVQATAPAATSSYSAPASTASYQAISSATTTIHASALAQPTLATYAVPQVIAPTVDAPKTTYVHKVKKTRPFADFWSYIGAGVSRRTVDLPLKGGEKSTFNFLHGDVRAGVVYKKTFGIEARLGTSTGKQTVGHKCGHGQSCHITLGAPLTAGFYARLQSPKGIGPIVPYGLLGMAYSSYTGTISDAYGSDSETTSHWDVSYGAGVEFMVTDLMSIGAEYMRHGHDDHGFGVNARYMF